VCAYRLSGMSERPNSQNPGDENPGDQNPKDQNPGAEGSADGPTSYEGYDAPVTSEAERREAVRIAFDYRGDVTLELRDGRVIEGFVYDRQEKRGVEDGLVLRVMPKDGSGRLTLRAADLTRMFCSGKDPAAGRSFETWVKKYAEKKLRGEEATFDPEKDRE